MYRAAMMIGMLTLVAQPASAATERIPLRFARAAEVERMLVGVPKPPPGGGGLGGAPQPRGHVPDGVSLLTTATVANELVVDGTPEGIAKVRELVRLVDIPARGIKLTVRVFPGQLLQNDAAEVPEDKANQLATVLSAKEVARMVKNGPAALVDVQLEGENNRPVRIYWSPREKKPISAATILCRVGGKDQLRIWTSPGAAADLPLAGNSVVLEPTPEMPYLVVSVPDAEVALVVQAEVVPTKQAKSAARQKNVATRLR